MLLSLVIPVYRVEEYLAECLDSIFKQPFTDYEVIAVNDGTDDDSAKILSWYAERYHQLRVVTLARNGGLGAARNAGIARATGRYVWCVDSDDWLPDGALAAVAERLVRTDPDLLVTGYARVYPGGRIDHHRVSEMGSPPEVFSFEEQPGLLNLLWIACNKVIRRRFLADSGLAFGPGWYEDIALIVPLMLAAERIALLDRYCYAYRQRPTGAITQTVSERHFDVFDQWERVFAFMDARPGRFSGLRQVIFQRMIWHCLQVLGHSSRVPRSLRRRYFARLTELYRRHVPPGGAAAPGGNDGLKQRLVGAGAYYLFEVLMLAWQTRGRMLRVARLPRQRRPDQRLPLGTG